MIQQYKKYARGCGVGTAYGLHSTLTSLDRRAPFSVERYLHLQLDPLWYILQTTEWLGLSLKNRKPFQHISKY